jgi:hypothetical protein
MSKPTPPPENLGSVPLNGGTSSTGKPYGGYTVNGKFVPHSVGELRREVDPTGKIVEHRVRRSAYVHERLHNLTGPQKLADELYDAAEKFRICFERARLLGSYATIDMFRTSGGGGGDVSDKVAVARSSIRKVFKKLGNGTNETSFSQSCVWHVVGLGMTLEEWTQTVRNSGKGMNADKGAGIFHGSLERLALHYGMVDTNRLISIGNDRAFGRGVIAANEFTLTCVPRPDETGASYFSRLRGLITNRFAKYLESR